MTSKLFKTYALFLLFILSSVNYSCVDQLDLYPPDAFAGDGFWTNQNNAMIALTGVYRGRIPINNNNQPDMNDIWSYSGIAYFDLCTDNGYDRRANDHGTSAMQNLTNGTMTASLGILNNVWSSLYYRISAANNFLANIDKVDMPKEVSDRMTAEARFLRATQFFYLTQFFYDVPMPTKVLTIDEANTIVKTPRAEIYTFIETELKEAAKNLPRQKNLPAGEIGRATEQAALGFLGRLYLSKKEWANAANVYKQIMDYGDNTLNASYTDLFTDVGIKSNENIFSILYLPTTYANYLPIQAYPNVGGTFLQGWGFHNPLNSLAECYDFIDGTPFSYDSPLYFQNGLEENNRDPRFRATFLCNGSTFAGIKVYTSPDSTHLSSCTNNGNLSIGGYATRTGYNLRKYFNESLQLKQLEWDYGGGFPVLRYAEVLLSYLEAKVEQGSDLNQDLLDNTINKVRGRTSVKMPPILISNLTGAGSLQDQLRKIVRKERRIELAFEGHRWWDIMRWDIGDEVLKGNFWGAPFPGSKTKLNLPAGYEKDVHERWFVIKRNFRTQDKRWPIPESQQNINPNLR